MTPAKYHLRGTLSDLTRQLVEASQISARQAHKVDPNATLDRILTMLNFLLGLLIASIAWVNDQTFAYSDLAYLLAFFALYGLSKKLLGRAAFLCAMGLTWALVVGASSLGYDQGATYLWVPAAMTGVGLKGVISNSFVGVVPAGLLDQSKLQLALDILGCLADRLGAAQPISLELDLRCPHRKPYLTSETWSGGMFNYLPPFRGHWNFSQPWMTLRVNQQWALTAVREVKVKAQSKGRLDSYQAWTESGRDLIEVQVSSREVAQIDRPLREVCAENDDLERLTLSRGPEPWIKAELDPYLPDPTPAGPSAPLQLTRDSTQLQHGIPSKFRGIPQLMLIGSIVVAVTLWELLKH